MMSTFQKSCFASVLLVLGSSDALANSLCTEKSLRKTVDVFGNAFAVADVATLNELLMDNYIHVNGGSGNVIRKQAWLNWLASRKVELDSGKINIAHYKVDLLNVVLTGDTAVVVGQAESSGVNKGVPFSSLLRFSNTWICTDLGWRRASFHDSLLD